jgi:hypothetical protein
VTTAEIGVRRAGGWEPLRRRWNVTVVRHDHTTRLKYDNNLPPPTR